MISKNIKKSSEFLLIAPDYLKIKDTREQNIKKSTMFSPKLKLNSMSNLQSKQKSKIYESTNLNKPIDKIKSISPRLKDSMELTQKARRVESSAKNRSKKSKKQDAKGEFERWKGQFFNSINQRTRHHIKSSYNDLIKYTKRQEQSIKFTKNRASEFENTGGSVTQVYNKLYERTTSILKKYKQSLKQLREENRIISLQNNNLKLKLSKYERK